jgi:translation elongation factor EF-G
VTKHFILIAGNIGSGKTSLTERVGARRHAARRGGRARLGHAIMNHPDQIH